jgi:hypothetical protein
VKRLSKKNRDTLQLIADMHEQSKPSLYSILVIPYNIGSVKFLELEQFVSPLREQIKNNYMRASKAINEIRVKGESLKSRFLL